MTYQPTLFDIIESRKRRDEGINKAVAHAESVSPNWSKQTFLLFKKFLDEVPGEFMAEDFRSWCAMIDDYSLPPSARAFGSVILKARKRGLIRWVGIRQVTNVKAHMANASVWVKNKEL